MISTKIVTDIAEVPAEWIFETYCGISTPLRGQSIKMKSLFNPADNNPSMFIFNKFGQYYFKDFSTGKSGTGVRLVAELENITDYAASRLIIDTYNKVQKNRDYKVVNDLGSLNKFEFANKRAWFASDLEYWKQFNISQELLENNGVFALESSTFSKKQPNGEINFYTIRKTGMYGYYKACLKYYSTVSAAPQIYKIYQPSSKVMKFMNIDYSGDGYSALGNNWWRRGVLKITNQKVIIVSSVKDGLSLLSCGYSDYLILVPHSESSVIDFYRESKYRMEGKNYILFDNDEPGQQYQKRYLDLYGKDYIIPLELPLSKDISDSVRDFGVDKVKTIIDSQL